MRQDRRDRDPWEGYEFIDINSRGEEAPPRPPREPPAACPAPSRRGRDKPARGSQKEPRQGRSQGGRDPAAGRLPNPAGRRAGSGPASPWGRPPAGFCWRSPCWRWRLLPPLCASSCCSRCVQSRSPAIRSTTPLPFWRLCGYQEGDNLALLTTGEQEAALEEQLPYVEDAQILRHFPSSLEIHITAAQQAACVQSGSQWFIISGKGKILEAATQPLEGLCRSQG